MIEERTECVSVKDARPSRPREHRSDTSQRPDDQRGPHFSGVTSITVARSRVHSSSVIGRSLMMYLPSELGRHTHHGGVTNGEPAVAVNATALDTTATSLRQERSARDFERGAATVAAFICLVMIRIMPSVFLQMSRYESKLPGLALRRNVDHFAGVTRAA
jgi:hypothetical protein